ncbi:hypothetical protein [Telluribacter humicola]|uniref:hypothetical protein n=1 Tax=Telluribacter humicola TaxID=1720261 RepID=UPI001A969673|nr:hypothetical protein [Telluribacter humicola]
MKEDNIDDLFRSNAEYLADQPHRDFNADLFWQQLRPELPQQATRPKRVAWWYWATAAAVLLAVGISIGWMRETVTPQEDKETLVQQVPAQHQAAPDTEASTRSEVPTTEESPERVATQVKPESPKEVLTKESVPATPAPAQEYRPEAPLVASTPPALEEQVNEPSDPLQSTTPAAPEPTYRIVHRNELMQQEKHENKARTQVVFRVGLPAATEPDQSSSRKPLAIPIFN